MYTLNIARAIKKIYVNEIRDFTFENCYKGIGFFKESSYNFKKTLAKDFLLIANKLIGKICDPRNAKERYELFLRKKNRKSVK